MVRKKERSQPVNMSGKWNEEYLEELTYNKPSLKWINKLSLDVFRAVTKRREVVGSRRKTKRLTLMYLSTRGLLWKYTVSELPGGCTSAIGWLSDRTSGVLGCSGLLRREREDSSVTSVPVLYPPKHTYPFTLLGKVFPGSDGVMWLFFFLYFHGELSLCLQGIYPTNK